MLPGSEVSKSYFYFDTFSTLITISQVCTEESMWTPYKLDATLLKTSKYPWQRVEVCGDRQRAGEGLHHRAGRGGAAAADTPGS